MSQHITDEPPKEQSSDSPANKTLNQGPKSKSQVSLKGIRKNNVLRTSDTNQLLAYSVYDPSNLKTAISTKIKESGSPRGRSQVLKPLDRPKATSPSKDPEPLSRNEVMSIKDVLNQSNSALSMSNKLLLHQSGVSSGHHFPSVAQLKQLPLKKIYESKRTAEMGVMQMHTRIQYL